MGNNGEDWHKTACLVPRQQAAIESLLCEPNVRRAALAASVGYNTLRRWLTQSDFIEAYAEAKENLLRENLDGLIVGQRAAVEVIYRLLRDDDARIRLSAARSLIEFGLSAAELSRVIERLERLHEAMRRADSLGGLAGGLPALNLLPDQPADGVGAVHAQRPRELGE